ncbi:MAG TPA: MnhB domain-containing protein, partial [Thermodesulfobacteriota bacterium]|nr:MnhB domain-containing protein [Thermodesulfobacteriota bacterium]
MNRRARLAVFLAGAIGLGILLAWGYMGLPEFGHYPGPYGDRINARVVSERHVTNAPTAVNFDYRGLDTLGEEYILFASVAAIILIIRRPWEELTDSPENPDPGRTPLAASEAARVFGFPFIVITMVFGVYIILHGIPTPGGGFHGGVIVASGSLLVYLAAGTKSFRRI